MLIEDQTPKSVYSDQSFVYLIIYNRFQIGLRKIHIYCRILMDGSSRNSCRRRLSYDLVQSIVLPQSQSSSLVEQQGKSQDLITKILSRKEIMDCYFGYLIIHFDYWIIHFDYWIIHFGYLTIRIIGNIG